MKKGLLVMTLIVLLIIGACTTTSTPDAQEDTNKAVQQAMKDFVNVRLAENDNTYPIKDQATEFDYLHDGVKEVDGLYVSCADFKSEGTVIDIDYYVKEDNGQYTVVKEVLHKQNKEEVNEVLWEQ